MVTETSRSIKIFYCYAEQDRLLKDELEKQLGGLKRLGKITTWDNRHTAAGTELQLALDRYEEALATYYYNGNYGCSHFYGRSSVLLKPFHYPAIRKAQMSYHA